MNLSGFVNSSRLKPSGERDVSIKLAKKAQRVGRPVQKAHSRGHASCSGPVGPQEVYDRRGGRAGSATPSCAPRPLSVALGEPPAPTGAAHGEDTELTRHSGEGAPGPVRGSGRRQDPHLPARGSPGAGRPKAHGTLPSPCSGGGRFKTQRNPTAAQPLPLAPVWQPPTTVP